jgi:hypothetical protein
VSPGSFGGEDGGGFAGDFRSGRSVARHPMTWSLPLVQWRGVPIRVHALFLLLVAVELLRAALPGMPRTLGLPATMVLMTCMVIVVLLHEWIRTWAFRRCGGDVPEWLLWPLGGFCHASSEGSIRQRRLSAAAPWLAQLALAAVLAAPLRAETGRWIDGGFPVPWSLEGFREFSLRGPGGLWEALWLLQWWNTVSLLLQMLPAFPLTGGRCLMAWLEPHRGWSESVRVTARAGIGSAVGVLVVGLAAGLWPLTVLALVLWLSARETLDRVDTGDFLQADPAPADPEAEPPVTDQLELDRILAKIKTHGMESLNWRERRRLKAATRRRQGGDPGSR